VDYYHNFAKIPECAMLLCEYSLPDDIQFIVDCVTASDWSKIGCRPKVTYLRYHTRKNIHWLLSNYTLSDGELAFIYASFAVYSGYNIDYVSKYSPVLDELSHFVDDLMLVGLNDHPHSGEMSDSDSEPNDDTDPIIVNQNHINKLLKITLTDYGYECLESWPLPNKYLYTGPELTADELRWHRRCAKYFDIGRDDLLSVHSTDSDCSDSNEFDCVESVINQSIEYRDLLKSGAQIKWVSTIYIKMYKMLSQSEVEELKYPDVLLDAYMRSGAYRERHLGALKLPTTNNIAILVIKSIETGNRNLSIFGDYEPIVKDLFKCVDVDMCGDSAQQCDLPLRRFFAIYYRN